MQVNGAMRVAVIINSKAGSVSEALVRTKVEEALFRCDLRFLIPGSHEETESFLVEESERADAVMICGGDGTINVTLRCLLKVAGARPLPPLCLVRSGTANDLALQIGVSRKIDRAARSILEGRVEKIDLIEMSADDGQKAVMMTNGGLGLPAATADAANRVRSALRRMATAPTTAGVFSLVAQHTYNAVKKIGPGIYALMAAEAMRTWNSDDWEVEIEAAGLAPFRTKASSILINNQPSMGKSFTPAPYTSNTDGYMNVLVTEAMSMKDQVIATANLMSGRPDRLKINRTFETPSLRLSSPAGARPLTFFGDGEILLKDVRGIDVQCRRQALPVFVRDEHR